MGSSGSRAGSLRRSSQSWRTGLGGAGCCADAVSGKAAAALPRKAMNSRLLIVASLIYCGDLISFPSILIHNQNHFKGRPTVPGCRERFELTLAFPTRDGFVAHRGLPGHDGHEDSSLPEVLNPYGIRQVSIGVPRANIVISKVLDHGERR